VMRGGILQQFGTPAEIYERPANVFVADFIGTPSMTLLDGELRRNGTGVEACVGPLVIPLDQETPLERERAEIKLGVRPEDVVLEGVGHPALVKVVEPTGHESIVLLALGDATVTARVPAHIRLAAGERARISFRTGKLHLFDRATGLRLAGGA
jgi:multiple sugar transport system ATP-binding protein